MLNASMTRSISVEQNVQEIESDFGRLFDLNCFFLKVVIIFHISETFGWNMKRGFLSNEEILQTKNNSFLLLQTKPGLY